ncbi:glycosyltransferase involved in cell wall biosynthesis [Ulvibacter sp. MAR_2010_11]|uniref:glycosyltransferase family 4 protein n=1 Tax=Ulvibacter sp. MAR_2010_11 TaxID=1250229 RepID=UPI000C2C9A3C|nr:glycosyltransferase family 4 protein [Ulvibacter sp. MAR_2010_11]PKA84355.1 glycosyltransferase involved in cell wall biosynthesis [Ulvibacter sp. MAR_2010_11]
MPKPKLIRITTVPISLEKLLEGQLPFMQAYFDVIAVASDKKELDAFGERNRLRTHAISLTRKITLFHDVLAVLKLFFFLRKEKPLIVHTHTPKAGLIGMLAAWFARVPIRLHTVAGMPLMEASGMKRRILNWVESLTYRCAHKVYPNSKGLYNFILSEKYTSEQKLKVLGEGSSNGINTGYFSKHHFSEVIIKEERLRLGIAETDFVFVFVGRIVRDKGINELVHAFTKLLEDSKNVKLLLVGPFEDDLDPIDTIVKQQINTNTNIVSVGYQSDVRIYFALSESLVFPSYREGFPNVVMQAGAMELPSIVSDINGCNEIIIEGENGLIVPPKSETELYKAMKLLVENNSLYKNLKSNARNRITGRFEQSKVWQAILEEYQLLQNKL